MASNCVELMQSPSPEKVGTGADTVKTEADEASQAKSCRLTTAVEKTALGAVIVAVVLLLSLPSVFFHMPVDDLEQVPIESPFTGNCSTALPYPRSGGICQNSLDKILSSTNCSTARTILVLRDNEVAARKLISRMEFLDPSSECREAVVPFLCQFLFGLCDSSGVSLQPTSGQCEDLRDRVCRREWSAALALGMGLPGCASFPSEQTSCSDQNPTNNSLPCREDFFREEDSRFCVPSCYTWYEYSDVEVLVTDLVIGLASGTGLIAGLAVMAISVISRKRMFAFPAIFIVFFTIDRIVLDILDIITFLDRPSLYCASRNLLEGLFQATPYCVITGISFSYIFTQMSLWWIFHTTSLFWAVLFPFRARSFKDSGKLKRLYIFCVVIGLTVPLLPVVASMAEFAVRVNSDVLLQARNVTFASGGLGYGSFRFPPLQCSGTSIYVEYYAIALPINIIVIVGLVELVLIFWTIYKHHGFWKPKETKFRASSTPQRKLLVTLSYYVLMTVLALTSFTVSTRNSRPFFAALLGHFACEMGGQDPGNPMLCDRDDFRRFSNLELTAVVSVLLSLLPVVNLVYVLNLKELRLKFVTLHRTYYSSNKRSTARKLVS